MDTKLQDNSLVIRICRKLNSDECTHPTIGISLAPLPSSALEGAIEIQNQGLVESPRDTVLGPTNCNCEFGRMCRSAMDGNKRAEPGMWLVLNALQYS